MKVTRSMVAERAGVSPQTVSYYVNGTRGVSEALAKRIKAAIDELGYAPDQIATSMVKNETRTIGVILNNIANPLYGEIVKELERVALRNGYFVNIFGFGDQEIRSYISNIIARRVDGIYITAIPTKFTEAELDRLSSAGIAVLTSVNRVWRRPDVGHIDPNFMDGMRQIVRHLADLGHREICYLTAFDRAYAFDNRLEAFETACREEGIAGFAVGGDAPYGTDLADGCRYTERLLRLRRPFTAVVATNDIMACGAIRALHEAGLSVPEDVSVVGIDDTYFARGYLPALTTLGYDKAEFAENVFDMLLAGIRGGVSGSRDIDMKLIVRESTAGCKK